MRTIQSREYGRGPQQLVLLREQLPAGAYVLRIAQPGLGQAVRWLLL
ncbi:MAG: hypothetical protein AAGJ82_03760 [Bacteroidota bacterium]